MPVAARTHSTAPRTHTPGAIMKAMLGHSDAHPDSQRFREPDTSLVKLGELARELSGEDLVHAVWPSLGSQEDMGTEDNWNLREFGSTWTLEKNQLQRKQSPQRIAITDKERLEQLELLPDGWGAHTAPAPTWEVLKHSERTLRVLQSILGSPDRIVPSVDGGVAFAYVHSGRYAGIELSNEHVVTFRIATKEDGFTSWIGDLSQPTKDIERLRDFLFEKR